MISLKTFEQILGVLKSSLTFECYPCIKSVDIRGGCKTYIDSLILAEHRQELGSSKEGKIVKMGNKVGPNRHIIGTFR